MKTIKTYSPKTKILSLVLSFLIIFYLVPTSVFAEGLDNDTTVSDSSVSVNEENNTNTPQIYEVTELREENVKHFRLEDGSYVAAQYNYPVHYADENGQLVDIDNRLSESGSEFSTGNSRVKFIKKITGNGNIFTLHENNTKITMNLVGAEKKTEGVITNNINSDESFKDALGKMTNLENLSSTILYEDILDGVDIEYIVHSLNIKENIIVKERKENYSYTFTIELNNLIAVLAEDGNVYINSHDGETKYVIPAPIVFDSNGNYAPTDAAAYTLNSSGNGKYNLTVSVLSEWMNDESRVFPITVDPPILGTSDCDIDLNIDSNYPNSNTNGNEEFYVSSTERAYLKFDESNFAVFPTGSTIMMAELNIIGSNLSDAPAKIGVYEITSNWDNSITWNKSIASPTQGSFSSELIDYIVVNSTGRHSWNITELYKGWIDGEVNNGLGLRLVDESATNERSYFTSWEYCPPGDDVNYYGPVIMVTYIYNDGLEDYYPTATHSVGAGGVGSINLSTGKMVLAIPTLTTTDSLFGFTPTLVYNSSLAGKAVTSENTASAFSTSYVGYGFKLNLCETIVKSQYKDADGINHNYYLLYDADGTVHRFYSSGNTTVYNDDDGLQLTLTINNSSIEIKDKSQTTKIYSAIDSSSWYLTQIKDKNNNSLIFEYNSNYKPTRVLVQPNGLSSIEMLKFIYNGNMLGAVYNSSSKASVIFRYSQNKLCSVEYYAGDSNTTEQDVWERAQDEEDGRYLYLFCTAEYIYNSNGCITRITDSDTNRSVEYEVTGGKITKISEYAGETHGQQVSYTYHDGYTDIRSTGNDEVLNTNDDIITRHIFDEHGRTVSAYSMSHDGSEIYGATMGTYDTTEKAKNSLKESIVVYDGNATYLDVEDGNEYYADLDGGLDKTEENGCYKQTVFELENPESITYNANKEYVISGFGYSNSVVQNSNAKFSLSVNVYYYQGQNEEDEVKTYHFDFFDVENTWQFISGKVDCRIGTESTSMYDVVHKIEVVCNYYGQVDMNGEESFAYFKDIAFTDYSNFNSYRYMYDVATGNLVMKTSSGYREYYEYNNKNSITRIANNKGEIYDFEYDTDGVNLIFERYYKFNRIGSFPGNLLYEYPYGESNIDERIIQRTLINKTQYTYTDYGQCESSTCYESNYYDSKIIASSYTYVETAGSKIFGAMLSETNPDGYTTKYFYDESNGNLLAQIDVEYGKGYAYSYDKFGTLVGVFPANGSATSYSGFTYAENVNYIYDENTHRLSKIITDSTEYSFSYDAFGNSSSVSAGNNTLATYEYYPNNGKLKKINYGNGFSEEYIYNALEMLECVCYNHSDNTTSIAYSYTYNADGTVNVFTNHLEGTKTEYEYDVHGRFVSATVKSLSDESVKSEYNISIYDEKGRVTKYIHTINYLASSITKDVSISTDLKYDNKGSLKEEKILSSYNFSSIIDYHYDCFNRLTTVNRHIDDFWYRTNYTYYLDGYNTSGLVSGVTCNVNGTTTEYSYEYDQRGNIASIEKDGEETVYSYDDIGQLIKEVRGNTTRSYVYDFAGNIISIETSTDSSGGGITPTPWAIINPSLPFTDTKTLGYSTSEWGDLLTSFNGTTITYDEIGNPLSYYNGTSYTFTWEGRRLVGAVKGSNTMSFTYDDNGIRTSKTVNGVVHTYHLNGSQIVAESWADKLLVYIYDASGSAIGMMYRTTSYAEDEFDVFWFEKNIQGDIVAVYNSAGTKVATYTYSDAWGNHSVSYTNGGGSTGAQYNPFRYRGYYYDTDLGMYYLQSRYYDSKICRFINADIYISTGYGIIGNNMFAYCNNIPTCYSDPEGTDLMYTCDYGDGYYWFLEGAGEGGNGGSGNYFGYGTAYYNYSVYSKNAALDANLGGYYYGGGGYIGGYTAQFAAGRVSVTDSMATNTSGSTSIQSPTNASPQKFTADQSALFKLAKEYKKTGMTLSEANIMWDWANEYGLSGSRYHGPQYDRYLGGSQLHFKINGIHINIYN